MLKEPGRPAPETSLCRGHDRPPPSEPKPSPQLRYSLPMQHPIDPKIDCVFKALLGSEGNRRLLIHFLNAVLGPALPALVVEVERRRVR